MFGHHKAKREKKKLKEQQSVFKKEKKDWTESPEREKRDSDLQKKVSSEKAEESRVNRKKATEEGRADTQAFLSKDIQGLDPATRSAIQYEASKGIQRNHQAANRKLLGEQSMHGIVGKGGVGYAQQRDLQRLANDAQGAATRDLTKLDRDIALKKQAAIFAGGQGEATQQNLDKQLAMDELQLAEEKKRQRGFEDKFFNQFTRA